MKKTKNSKKVMKSLSKKLKQVPKAKRLTQKQLKERQKEMKFPVSHLSYSSMKLFGVNGIMFALDYLMAKEDRLNRASNIAGLMGKAVHKGIEIYHGGVDEIPISSESEALYEGMKGAYNSLYDTEDSYIQFSKRIPDKKAALEKIEFMFNNYVTYFRRYREDKEYIVDLEQRLTEHVQVEWKGQTIALEVPLKVIVDKVYYEVIDGKKRLCITDFKTCGKFSDPEKIDGAKMLQVMTNFFAVYMKYGEIPYSFTFEEIKHTKNQDKSIPQVKAFTYYYEDNDMLFDFFLRYYGDVVNALAGKGHAFVPNVEAMFDNDIAMIAYIHRLDDPEVLAATKKKRALTETKGLVDELMQLKKAEKKLEKALVAKRDYKPINFKDMTIDRKIETKLLQFGKHISFKEKIEGNTLDMYLFEPHHGVSMKSLLGHTADIEQIVGVAGVRILAPVPNTHYVGIEVPRKERKFIELPEVNETSFDLMIGEDVFGKPLRYDIREAPHMLIAGSTGSGKSVFVHSMLAQMIENDEIELHLFDPKRIEFDFYSDEKNVVEYLEELPDMHESLKNLVDEMNNRYRTLKKNKTRDIKAYNKKVGGMKYKFIFIEEFADIIASNYTREKIEVVGYYKDGREKIKITKENLSKEMENYILMIAQKARAAGIHVILSTQRPSVDIIKGTIKANFPVKVAFRTSKAVDSKVIIDEEGAEKLLGKGDMLFSSELGIIRLQGYSI